MFTKSTPVLVVETIEPSLPFWVDRLGFTKTMEVPHESALGFVGLERDGIEIMYQSRASAVADDENLIGESTDLTNIIYIEVADIDWLVERLGDVEVVVPLRETDYGMREVFIREPGGHVIGFAASAAEESSAE